ncbi:hypothetical protein MXM64_01435 [Kurthia gibsonii]|uniref:hypothetical protein n=1 Tax=Kurthia gibsonii TaxID=33946 RepID=UPI002DBD1B6D|nr:hypothetical protein [Kurthia gibsonii]MEB6111703.1 hypothetical protein [Kurthia gibsonii]
MSLKGIELQIAIPKTFDAGKQVEQAQQQVHAGQDLANAALNKQIEKNHTSLLESEKLKELRQDEPKDQERERKEKEEREENEKLNKNRTKHPYKGNFFDFSG